MTTTAPTYQQGDVVIYEDIANYDRYVVVRYDRHDPFNPYLLCHVETGTVTRSDMKQRGWRYA